MAQDRIQVQIFEVLRGAYHMTRDAHGFGQQPEIHRWQLEGNLLNTGQALAVLHHAQCCIVENHE